MKPKIGIITLGVSDLKKSLKFYRDGLGFPTHEYKDDAGIVFFKLEGTWLALYPRDELVKDLGEDVKKSGLNISSGPGPVGGVTLAHNEKTKEEVDATVQLAVKAGAKLVKQPGESVLGRLLRLLRRSRRPPVGSGLQSFHGFDLRAITS